MKVLVSAHACLSRGGSEGYFGWSAVQALSKDHDLWVLTSSRNQLDLEQAQSDGLIGTNVQFIFVGGPFQPWPQNRLVARLQSWKEYFTFSRACLPLAKSLHEQFRFDLVHHVTVATWRIASTLWKIGIPFIFGPVGGNERFPFRFFSALSFQAKAFELLRMLSNCASRLSSSVRACIRGASHVLVANFETLSLLRKLGCPPSRISLLNPGFYSNERITEFSRSARFKTIEGPLRIFAGGNLEGRKGVALALYALAQLKTKGVHFHYRLGGGGPEFSHLRRLSQRLGLQGNVTFGEPLLGQAYQRELGQTHLFLLPSLRESSGLTMMEAMLAGCVPIVADCGGPRHIVTDECGYKIPLSNPNELVHCLTKIIFDIDRNRDVILAKGRAAVERISSHFNEQNYRKSINEVYWSVTNLAQK